MNLVKKRLLLMMVALSISVIVTAQAQDDVNGDKDTGAAQPQTEEDTVDKGVEEVIVYGVRSAELNARKEERKKDIFSSIISQDDAGNFADQNVAESLQRLPGVVLQKSEGEGKHISLRGLGPNFVSVNMNGSEIASAGGGVEDSEDRGFSLDSIPADVLQSIEVHKTLTADMDLNSIGGTVNVKTLSALDKGKNSLKLSFQSSYQDYAGELSPKFTAQGTNVFADDTFGVGYSFSYEKRTTQVYESRHHDSTLPRYVFVDDDEAPPSAANDRMLIPFELQNRQENAERTRLATLVDFDFRPSERQKYYLRFSRTEYEDEDIAIREYYRFGQSGTGETAYVDPANNVFGLGGVDLQHQFFIQEATSTTDVLSLGGENLFGEDWTLEYEYSSSKANLDKPDGRRVQFRIRDMTALGQFGPEFINGQTISPSDLADLAGLNNVAGTSGNGPAGYIQGNIVQGNMLYDNIFIEPSFREDTIDQVSMDLRKEFASGALKYIKGGFKVKNRERDRDKDRASVVPGDKAVEGCLGDLNCVTAAGSLLRNLETYIPEHPNFDHAVITQSAAEQLLAITRSIADNYDPENREIESNRRDYNLTEDALAIYFMGEFQLSDTSTLIAGLRYEETEFTSTGNFTIRNDRDESATQLESFDYAIPLDITAHKYGDVFPSVHYRNELSDELLFRAAFWTSFSRPSFDQNRAFAQIVDRVTFCNNDPTNSEFGNCSDRSTDLEGDFVGTQAELDAWKAQNLILDPTNAFLFGNPELEPMASNNFDISLGWYADDDLFLQGAFFYKDISDFIVNASGIAISLDELPFRIPVEQITTFNIPSDLNMTNVSSFINGKGAEVYGIELTYSQNFTQGWLNGFFIHTNLTLQESDADVGQTIRAGRIQLPDQADLTFNGTFGWENDIYSIRAIANYRGEILKRIGACNAQDIADDQLLGYAQNCQTWADTYQADSLTFDLKATWQMTDDIKLYFDAINITDEGDFQYFRGNQFSGGNMMYRSEDYGRSYIVGMNYKFY